MMRKQNFGSSMAAAAVAAVMGLTLIGCSQTGAETTGDQNTADSAAQESAAEENGASQEAQEQENSAASGTEAEEASQSEAARDDLLAQIRERGEVIVAMEGTWSPWTYHNEDDELVGYDVEVAQAIAEHLGVGVSFVEGEWDGLFAGLDAGRYDMVVNGVEITDERAEKYDFSEPYAYNRTAIIVSGDNEEIQSFEDLSGKNTANTISSTYAELAESYGANVTGVDDLNQTFELLLSGRIDATLNAELTYYDYMKAHPDANIKIAALTQDASEVAIPMRKGAETESLRAAVNEAIDEMRASGELAQLSEKYFDSDISQAPQEE
ncbi:MAG: transporter substrate-binding domain-containing protein [Eubacteriales bacterium]|nr:transporter substrate-binding domain-containing protein [Eubacteriales bacterium]